MLGMQERQREGVMVLCFLGLPLSLLLLLLLENWLRPLRQGRCRREKARRPLPRQHPEVRTQAVAVTGAMQQRPRYVRQARTRFVSIVSDRYSWIGDALYVQMMACGNLRPED